MKAMMIWPLLIFALISHEAFPQTYRGSLVCTSVPGSPPTTASRLTVALEGSHAKYSHQVKNFENADTALVEIGTGTIVGNKVSLSGKAVARGFHDSATYVGLRDADTLHITGEQTWTIFMAGVKFTWPCTATLRARRPSDGFGG